MGRIQISDYPILDVLRSVATRGGVRGKLYDRGVLDAIAFLERDGSLPNPSIASLIILYATQKNSGVDLLSKEEATTAESFMRANSWEFSQAEEYCSGFDSVERVATQLGIGQK